MSKTLTALLILDGFGASDQQSDNAVYAAKTPNIDRLMAQCPHTTIQASGLAVGLPEGQMGNSEVGHLNIGAGRVVYQELTRITKSIQDGDFFENPAMVKAMDNAKETGHALHVFGLCSDGGVHSHIDHFIAVVEMAAKRGLEKVFVHCFMDGRDVPPSSGKGYLEQMQAALDRIGVGKIATVIGRYYVMDRDNRWERVEQAYNALAFGEGNLGTDAVAMVQENYDRNETDEFIKPIVITENGAPIGCVQSGDSVIFVNFRPDRAREITRAFLFQDFDGFTRKNGWFPLQYVSMTQYDANFAELLDVAFKPVKLTMTLGEYMASQGKTQLRIAETEKYAHVTFFFNGGVEKENEGEDRALIPSPKVATYDLKPEMSAYEVAEEAEKRVRSGQYDLMILNFANPDMVGHTGIMDAAVKAVETVDACVGRVVDAIVECGGSCLITADHGNAEMMKDESGEPMTAHTTNVVPLICVDKRVSALEDGGALCDIAPTLLAMMGLEQPAEMTGRSLIK
ncbi:MAG: 2,3-bisphosphoglycerate-independent phosphoglycerate mutase [Clostridia bacterium]|nr:2,3-bisphosphoglycerate-independent phosphoglycerate mutase [Clostridia bacterium]